MSEHSTEEASPESLRTAMEFAWRDHHHARDQTWKTVQIVVVLGAAFLSIDFKFENPFFTTFAAILVSLAAAVGVGIAKNHRALERRKFIHIMNCEEKLGLHRDDILPLQPIDENYMGNKDEFKAKPSRVKDGAVGLPNLFETKDAFKRSEHNTSLFIVRIHLFVLGFCILVVSFRWLSFMLS